MAYTGAKNGNISSFSKLKYTPPPYIGIIVKITKYSQFSQTNAIRGGLREGVFYE
jgi:hypothetical protein